MEGIVLFQAAGTAGSLKHKHLTVAKFRNWELSSRSRDDWTVRVQNTTDAEVDIFIAEHHGPEFDLELCLSDASKGKWVGRARIVQYTPLALVGVGSIEAVDGE